MTDEERVVEERVQRIINEDIYACQSGLVSDLIQLGDEAQALDGAFDLSDEENVCNMQTNPESWSQEECTDWLEERGIDFDEPLDSHNEDINHVAEDDDQRRKEIEEDYLDALKELVRDNAESAEVLEWWLVSSWLARKLEAHGAVVLDNGYGTWWGRQGSGQAISMDGIMQRIAEELYR